MKKISIRIADLLLRKHHIEESMYNIYQYGLQMTLEIGCSFITSIIVCYIWGKVIEGILFFVIFIPLRSYLGGFHMKSYWACFICSLVTLIAVLGLSPFAPKYYISWLILGISIVMIFFEAKKEKMKDAEGRYFYPKICVIILLILITGIVFTALHSSSKMFLLACTNALVAASKLLERVRAKEET